MGEVELHDDESKSKKETDEKSLFVFILEVIETNSYKLKFLTRLSFASWGSK